MKKVFTLALSFVLISTILMGCGANNSGEGNKNQFDSSSEIVVVTREEGSGTRGAFVELAGIEEKDSNGNKTDRTTKEAITQMKTDTVLKTVAGDEYAIGYVSTGSLNDSIKTVKIDGIEPTVENIKNNSYKLSRSFNIATKKNISEVTQDFIDFIMSKEGQQVVSKSYIAVNLEATPYGGSKPTGKIVVAGSSSVTPIMEKLREAYIVINPNAEIEVQQSDSSAGIKAVTDGTADIGMASRELKDSEKANLNTLSIALDGIAIIINPSNTMSDISLENIKNIFIGEFTNWNEVK